MYLLEIIERFGVDQRRMFIAVVKFKVKVLGNFSDKIIELSNLTVLAVGIVESASHWKQ
jgi:hypothetical protein